MFATIKLDTPGSTCLNVSPFMPSMAFERVQGNVRMIYQECSASPFYLLVESGGRLEYVCVHKSGGSWSRTVLAPADMPSINTGPSLAVYIGHKGTVEPLPSDSYEEFEGMCVATRDTRLVIKDWDDYGYLVEPRQFVPAAAEATARSRWNERADMFNQWGELSGDEKELLIRAVLAEQQKEELEADEQHTQD